MTGRRPAGRLAAPAAFAILTMLAAAVVAVDPAGSAGRHRDGDKARKERKERKEQPDRSSRRFRGDQGAANGRPAQFLAEQGGRIVVVSAETGRVDRYLTGERPGGGAEDPALSPDGRTVWFSRGEGKCAAHLASVPLGGGKEQKLRGSGEAGHEGTPLPRPGRPHIAYARVDCKEPSAALIVGDLAGLEGHGQLGIVPLAWSRDGTRLLARAADGSETRLLEVNESGAIATQQPLDLVDTTEGCRLEVVGFSPDDNNGFVAVRRCGVGERARRSLVLLDKDGRYRKTVVRLGRGQDFIDRPAFDPSGHSLLFSSGPAQVGGEGDSAHVGSSDVTLWLWRDGDTRMLARPTSYRHPSWLP